MFGLTFEQSLLLFIAVAIFGKPLIAVLSKIPMFAPLIPFLEKIGNGKNGKNGNGFEERIAAFETNHIPHLEESLERIERSLEKLIEKEEDGNKITEKVLWLLENKK